MGRSLSAFPIRVLAAVFALAAIGGACDSKPTTKGTRLPTVQMQIGDKAFTLEVADTDELRRTGLMRRDSMPKDHGMIFVFGEEAPLGFYMRNTRIPLDIIYIDAKGKIVSIKQMQPHDEKTTKSDGPAQYAIELNQGVSKRVGIKAGDVLELPKGLKAKD